MKHLIIASTSTIYGGSYLAYLLPRLKTFFLDADDILFIPYARPSGISYDNYTEIVQKAFSKINKNVIGIHQFNTPKEAIKNATAIFTGGGNTFELTNQLYKNDILQLLKETVKNGARYLGTSAGSNICGITMMNTNDMPIVYPPSFKTMELIPFNINAHYLDPVKNSTHMGETRETRIKEFHVFNNTPVLGLREGSWLEVTGNKIILCGNINARFFRPGKKATELTSGSEVLI